MRSIRIVGLCLVAVFAFSAVAAASAMAEGQPTFNECKKLEKVGGKYTGTYTNKECTTEATPTEKTEGKKNKYELVAASGTFTGKSKATKIVAKSTTGVTEEITCAKDTVTIEIFPPSGFVEKVTLSKCKNSKGEPCQNAGSEEIQVEGAGELYWINAGETAPGTVSYMPVAFKCGTATVEIIETGLISTVENNGTKGFKIVSAVNGSGEQADRAFFIEGEEVGGPYVHLNTQVNGSAELHEATLAGTEEIKAKDVSVR